MASGRVSSWTLTRPAGAANALSAAGLRVWFAAAALAAVLTTITAYEHIVFGWHFAREVAPEQSAWHWLRTGITAALSLLAVAAIAGAAREGRQETPVGGGGLAFAWAVLAASVLLTALLIANPRAYRDVVAEDSLVEWLGTAALFVGSALCGLWLQRLLKSARPGNWIHLVAAAGFAALFFVMGMEEISWGQRIIGFATPESIAAENWQGEFNLHNMQTDVAEFALFTGTGLFLVIVPLVRERLHHWRLLAPFAPLMPDRSVALISAPMLAFDYARWNLLPIQAVLVGGLAACLLFASTGARARRRREAIAFAAVSTFIFVGQAIHLLLGDTMIEIHDPSEFRETILSLGIAWYGWRQWQTSPVQ
jgi:hypothetical protein